MNWKATVVEFIVVMLGIFAGLQADSWYEGIKDREREAVHLAQLREDFDFNAGAAARNANHHRELVDELMFAVGVLRRGEINEDEQERFKWAVLRMLQYGPAGFTTGGYETLIGSGELSLIQDQELKSRMVRLHGILSIESSRLAGMADTSAGISNLGDFAYAIGNPNGRGIIWQIDFDQLKSMRGALGELANHRRNHEMLAEGYQSMADEFSALRDRIDEILADRT